MYFKPYETGESEEDEYESENNESGNERFGEKGSLGLYSNDEDEDESDEPGDEDDSSNPAGSVSVDL
jgi:hypothetical protein